MASNSFSIRFFLNEAKKSASGIPIYVRIIVDRKKTEFSLREFLPDSGSWDKLVQRAKGKKYGNLNDYLDNVKDRLNKIRRKLLENDEGISASKIKEIFQKKDTPSESVLDYLESYINYLKEIRRPDGTVKNFVTTKGHLSHFLKKRNQQKILLKDLNRELIAQFDNFLLTQPSYNSGILLKKNSAIKYHKKLKTVLNRAVILNKLEKNPYDGYPLKEEKTQTIFLRQHEIDAIMELKFGNNNTLELVRDVFIFSMYSGGLRISDTLKLKKNRIIDSKDGKYWLDDNQKKTDGFLGVPLLKYAASIYLKYKDKPSIGHKLFPPITQQYINRYLKIIADLAGIEKKLSHKVARHTFATTVALRNKVPLPAISRWMGHSSVKVTQVYTHINSEYLGEIADDLNEKV